jgi:amidophosphoribosyltransferase
MTERGPDSAGMAVFGQPLPEGQRKISVYSGLTEAGATTGWA